MSKNSLVPSGTTLKGSEQSGTPVLGAAPKNRSESSPSFFGHLTDNQLLGLSVFCGMHPTCEEVEISPIWGHDLQMVLELFVACPSCAEHRTFLYMGGGE